MCYEVCGGNLQARAELPRGRRHHVEMNTHQTVWDSASDVADYRLLLDDIWLMQATRLARCAGRSPSHGSTRQLGPDRDRRKRQAPDLYGHISETERFPGNRKNVWERLMWPRKIKIASRSTKQMAASANGLAKSLLEQV